MLRNFFIDKLQFFLTKYVPKIISSVNQIKKKGRKKLTKLIIYFFKLTKSKATF